MQVYRQFIFIFILFLCFACGHKEEQKWKDLNGNVVSLSDYKGKWVLINYWATWCGPCEREIPVFNQIAQEQSNKVAVLGVNFDNLALQEAKEATQKMGILYPVLQEDPEFSLHLKEKIQVLPSTIVINPEGKFKVVLYGEQTMDSLNKIISP